MAECLIPTIRVILEDDNGQAIEQNFALPCNLETLDSIDEAVEQFKNQALPQVEQQLLHNAQERLAAQEKKTVAFQQR